MTALPRVGLIGTGTWARMAHAPAIAGSDRVEFAGVWGRDPAAAAELGGRYGARAAASAEELIATADIIAFAVPPDVQEPLALRAAEAGRHLLLEKPTAFSARGADALAEAVEARGLASVVLFTFQLDPRVREWTRRVAAEGAWLLQVQNVARTLVDPDNPFGASPWRRERGLLWDVGPHEVALARRMLGPVTEVQCTRGPGDLTILVTRHRGGGRAEITVRGDAPIADAATRVLTASGAEGPPDTPWDGLAASSAAHALALLADAAEGRPSAIDLDARFGAEVTRVLEAAERAVAMGAVVEVG